MVLERANSKIHFPSTSVRWKFVIGAYWSTLIFQLTFSCQKIKLEEEGDRTMIASMKFLETSVGEESVTRYREGT